MTKLKELKIESGRAFGGYLNANSPLIEQEGFRPKTRVRVSAGDKSIVVTLSIEEAGLVGRDEIGLTKAAFKKLGAEAGREVSVKALGPIKSFAPVREKMYGHEWTEEELLAIITDVLNGNFSDSHTAAFCMACEGDNMTEKEIAYLTKAMVETGETIDWNYDIVVDKHCIGGVPGNRTTNLVIPIVAAYGLHIPKTSSRAITSPSGTADTMEVFAPVDLGLEGLKRVVEKVGGCLAWGGGVDLSPSDDIIINTKKDINVDSEGQMVASITSKKLAAGSTHVLIDIPVGPTAKAKDMVAGERMKKQFETLGKNLGRKILVVLSDGSQPIGNGIGPVPEAHDIMSVLKDEANAPQDLKAKAIKLAGLIIEFDPKVKEGEGAKIAKEILENGKALQKFLDICEAQGGLRQIPEPKFKEDILADRDGEVKSFENRRVTQAARLLGAPISKVAGLVLHKHVGDKVQKGEKIVSIQANSEGEIAAAKAYLAENPIMSF